MRVSIVCLMLFALMGCGTAQNSPVLAALRTSMDGTGAAPERPVDLAEQKAALVRAYRNSRSDESALLVTLPRRQAVASLAQAGENSGVITWFDTDGLAIMTQGGVIVATRGFGEDVMASDISEFQDALRGNTSRYTRSHRVLNGIGQLLTNSFDCTATRSRRILNEHCLGSGVSFENRYDFRDGQIVSSRQWLGPQTGYADIILLR